MSVCVRVICINCTSQKSDLEIILSLNITSMLCKCPTSLSHIHHTYMRNKGMCSSQKYVYNSSVSRE